MKKRIIILILIVILIVACEKTPSKSETREGKAECTTDDDCVKGGCSGTICQSKDAEPVFTTCEWLPEYACYKQIQCKCLDNKCQWDKTKEFNKCVEEARKSDKEIIV